MIDIEREVVLGGPIHSKGVLILSNLLGARNASERLLSLSASIVFEQSYGGAEGDSASCADLYALLSAQGEIPINQSFAVTGSVNQHGQVQAIGGVNEKIEGFFDICHVRGLTGEQGVLIPQSNVKHLMRIAMLPVSRCILFPSATEEPLDSTLMEHELKALAHRMQMGSTAQHAAINATGALLLVKQPPPSAGRSWFCLTVRSQRSRLSRLQRVSSARFKAG